MLNSAWEVMFPYVDAPPHDDDLVHRVDDLGGHGERRRDIRQRGGRDESDALGPGTQRLHQPLDGTPGALPHP